MKPATRPLGFGLSLLPAIAMGASNDRATDAMSRDETVRMLSEAPVSRLEWGILKLERMLNAQFETDPETLAPFDPPFFINMKFDRERSRLIIEIGRTFGQLAADRAAPLCREYVNRVRIQFNIDRVGNPLVGAHSSLAAEYFQPLTAGPPDPAFAHAVDRFVYVQGLVASPLTGAYAVCGAGIRDTEVRNLD